jgi:hypothetical protein
MSNWNMNAAAHAAIIAQVLMENRIPANAFTPITSTNDIA